DLCRRQCLTDGFSMHSNQTSCWPGPAFAVSQKRTPPPGRGLRFL
ncbi:MAG: hypothetical protein AVDCRST_MAG56-49, partial [uncultured Cytophagales bacterium]